MGAGVAYMARKFMGGRRSMSPGYNRTGLGGLGIGGSRNRRGMGW